MNVNRRPFLFLFILFAIVSMACGLLTPSGGDGGNGGAGATPTAPASKAVNRLVDVQQATVQIVAQGTFADPQVGLIVNAAGSGSGFIIDPSGIAVTNNHVVAGAALVKVWVAGESTPRNARILGLSECSDLAVIDIDGDGFSYLEWYKDPVQVGLEVYAAGFPLGEPEYTLTKGIVSKEAAAGQTDWASIDRVLGHDATINPGNSGGPLVNSDGKVVGVNYRGRPNFNQYFAIGKDIAISLIEEMQKGRDVNSIGINGVAVMSEDGSLSGIWVSSVKSGSPADLSGIKAGDIVYQLEGLVLATDGTMKDYCDVIRSHQMSDTMAVTVIRFGTGEILEGQLNGRTLAVTGNFNTGGSTGGTSPTPGSGSTGSTTEPLAFYTEEFDGDVSNWSFFEYLDKEDGFVVDTRNGRLVFDIKRENRWVYVTYDAYTYSDVIISAVAENLGMNNNNVSLICRYDPDKDTWYEFNIANNGLYWIFAHANGDYQLVYNGGSTAIKQGRNTNEYAAFCVGDRLGLFINGVEVRVMQETTYRLREGRVGVSVSSFDTLPILVEIDSFTIAEP